MAKLMDGNVLKDRLVIEHGRVEFESTPNIMDLNTDIGGAQSFLQGYKSHSDIVDACGARSPICKLQV
jgi:hypothetical protein